MKTRKLLTLTEYQPLQLDRHELPEAAAQRLWRDFRPQVEVEPPSFKTGDRWRLTAQGWVGFLPLSPTLGIALQPKLPLRNLFGMLELAYDLRSLQLWDDLFAVDSLEELYEGLALILARRILSRVRSGLAQRYLPRSQSLPFVRGRIDTLRLAQQPMLDAIPSHFSEQSIDTEENQILLWSLQTILRSGLCTARSLPTVRQAQRALHGAITLRPYSADDCRNRSYSRLDADYRLLHLLCAFFLDQSGPTHELGDHEMPAFVVDTARLYERFVAEWLRCNLPAHFHLQSQERLDLTPNGELRFEIDLVLYDDLGQARWVMDTKYKAPPTTPASDDVAQVLAYAQAKGAPEAVLIYPIALSKAVDQQINGIRLRTLTFHLTGNLDNAGREFLAALMNRDERQNIQTNIPNQT